MRSDSAQCSATSATPPTNWQREQRRQHAFAASARQRAKTKYESNAAECLQQQAQKEKKKAALRCTPIRGAAEGNRQCTVAVE